MHSPKLNRSVRRLDRGDVIALSVPINWDLVSSQVIPHEDRCKDTKCGSSDWTRTSNHSINSRVLCQLSYGGMSALGRSPRRDYQIAIR